MATTYAKGTDPRNMTRSTLVRHLRNGVTGTPESKTLKRRVFDEVTIGWAVRWTNSQYADTVVEWVNGTTISDRGRTSETRDVLRDAALDEIETVLKDLGYVTKREWSCIAVLRRMGA